MLSRHASSDQAAPSPADDIVYPQTIPFILLHLSCLAAIWTGVTLEALVICATLYVVRMFAVTERHLYLARRWSEI